MNRTVASLVGVLIVLLSPSAARGFGVRTAPGANLATGATRPWKPPPIPVRAAIRRAWKFADEEPGVVSAAVIDSNGRLSALRGGRLFVSASMVKALMLVAFLRELAEEGEELDSDDSAVLSAMITVSDNNAADDIYYRLGDEPIEHVARLAGARTLDVRGYWGETSFTAVDCARFIANVRRLLPDRFRRYGMRLLASIVGYERWGIPAGAGPHWRVWFKGGWRTTDLGALTHQMGVLRQRHRKVAIAVLTDGMPSMADGEETIEGVTERLLPQRVPPVPWKLGGVWPGD